MRRKGVETAAQSARHASGRDLHIEYAEKTLNYLQRLWGREVVLETVLDGKRSLLCCNDRGFSVRALK